MPKRAMGKSKLTPEIRQRLAEVVRGDVNDDSMIQESCRRGSFS
jgi:hypothetical protein